MWDGHDSHHAEAGRTKLSHSACVCSVALDWAQHEEESLMVCVHFSGMEPSKDLNVRAGRNPTQHPSLKLHNCEHCGILHSISDSL